MPLTLWGEAYNVCTFLAGWKCEPKASSRLVVSCDGGGGQICARLSLSEKQTRRQQARRACGSGGGLVFQCSYSNDLSRHFFSLQRPVGPVEHAGTQFNARDVTGSFEPLSSPPQLPMTKVQFVGSRGYGAVCTVMTNWHNYFQLASIVMFVVFFLVA